MVLREKVISGRKNKKKRSFYFASVPQIKHNILTKSQIYGSRVWMKKNITSCFLNNIHLNLSEHCFQVSTDYIQVCEKKSGEGERMFNMYFHRFTTRKRYP